MTKYVGKHRKPPKWTHRKTIASTLITTGILSIHGSSALAQTLKGSDDDSPLSPPTLRLTTSYEVSIVPEPPVREDGGREELEQWLAAGGPGYIPDPRDIIKGIVPTSVTEPEVVVVQATCERAPASSLGLTLNAAKVHEVICALFPEITEFGGLRPGDPLDHGSGNAIDAMVDPVTGDRLAQWLIDHWDELPLKYIIWEQRISYGGAWQGMEDRGSPTQNHYDHVHISVY